MVGLLCIVAHQGFSQVSSIGGPINTYTSITTIHTYDENSVDSLTVVSLDGFFVGDTVMVHCVNGSEIDLDPGEDAGTDNQENLYNQGKYAFLIIDSIDVSGKLVILNNRMPNIQPMVPGEVAQLIKVKSYKRAEVTSELTAPPWNGSTGGVVALFVQRTLTLSADINVSGKGFRGASESLIYNGDCASSDPVEFDKYFYLTGGTPVRAGLKGEGITLTTFDQMRGKARNINGGGGGNARLSGGGGGSNHNAGGKGGSESTLACDSAVDTRGVGGINLDRYYYVNEDDDAAFGNRAFFGGGGGRGTNVSGQISSDGGNGGGLVVIVADSIVGNGGSIIADGASVSNPALGAGGGGGGGGAIILDANSYGSTLSLRAVGGDGGDTNHPTDITGPGGGGGGGVYWLSGNSHSGVNMNTSDNGQPGQYLGGSSMLHGAEWGGEAEKIDMLRVPLRGFLFNTVPDEFTVCSNVVPETIYAGLPKGGGGPSTYEYEWLDSTSTHTWQPATAGPNNTMDFHFTQSLPDTTWFRRVVTSGAVLPSDTSFRIAVYVHPAITDNTVSAPDTVCKGDQPLLFSPSATIGGGPTGGTYTYRWQKDENDGSGFTDADGPGDITGATYQAPGLDTTTNFARIAYAGVCVDTSAPLTVTVLEPLTNFEITPFDTVCYNTELPDELTSQSGPPADGDQSDIRYQWFSSTNATDWTDVGVTSETFSPPALTQTTYFRRGVLSGSDDACTATSDYVEILNIALITDNTISAIQTVCTGDQPDLLTGSDPGGGVPGQYKYLWQSRTASTGWGAATGINDIKSNFDPGVMSGDTTLFRRVVGSGGVNRDVCLNNGTELAINVLPSITNNVITVADNEKCQGDQVDPLNGTTPMGGDGAWTYKWEVAAGQDSPESWVTIGSDEISITDPSPLDSEHDRWYRRIIFSGPGTGPEQVCKDTTELHVTLHTGITGNTIVQFDSVCFADTKTLLGETPVGEEGLTPLYTWKDLDAGSDLPGSDQEDFTTDPYNALGNYNYKRLVQIGACTDLSESMTITVMELPGGTLTDDAFRACEQDIGLAIDLNMDGLETYVLPWEVTLKNQVATGIGPLEVTGDGTLPVTLDIDVDSLELNYELESITYHSVGGRYSCTAPAGNMSGVVPIHVFRKPEPQILVDGAARDSFKVCNTTVTLVADADNGTASWSNDPSGVFFTKLNQDEYLASIPNNHDAFGKYTLTFTSEAGDCAGQDMIDIHYFEQPADAYAGRDTFIYMINTIQLNADPPTAGVGTWELVSGGGIIADEHAHNTYASELALGEENKFNWTVTNGSDEGICVTSSDVTIVLRNELKRYDGFSPNEDMHNEYFIMQGLAYADEFSISFFNALGNTVVTIDQDNVGGLDIDPSLITNGLQEDELVVWDGLSSNGNLVPSGTYYYAGYFFIYEIRYELQGSIVVVSE
ncbi:MAG: gliding motility-associated C-terminal domain-containing protein [Bacteroidota bacterium]